MSKNAMKNTKLRKSKSGKSYLKINNTIYVGSLKVMHIFGAICGGFVRSPRDCLFINNGFTSFLSYK